jgi:tetratricopeptide (TPR) repeat protein
MRRSAIALLLIPATFSSRSFQSGRVTIAGLGTIDFPVTTASDSARQAFLRGTLLMHLFHYPRAVAAFREAERLDSGFTMAWWGEAMAFNYAVWSIQYPDSGRAALARLGTPATRDAKARTPREREYLESVETLYSAGSKAHRDTAYAAAIKRLSAKYPHDDEARLLYALALLGLNQGVRDVPTFEHAYAVALDVFRRHPDHPGASHYVIHATDDPAHAALGLGAAQALAQSSPIAEHAQHMTSHIFLALGMWDDVVKANERSMHIDTTIKAMGGMKQSTCGHGVTWLHYGYLAQGRVSAATDLLTRCQAGAQARPDSTPFESMDPDDSWMFSAVSMWTRYLIDSEDWSGAQSRWTPALGNAPGPRLTYCFAKGFAAAKRGDLLTARTALAAFQSANRDATAAAKQRGDASPLRVQSEMRARVLDLELQAAIQSAANNHDEAVALLRRATPIEDQMAYAFGPPGVDKPSHELLGDELLILKQGAAARKEFQLALKTAPRRPTTLRGLALADEAAGLPAEATSTWRQLASIWHLAEATLPGLDAARRRAREQP